MCLIIPQELKHYLENKNYYSFIKLHYLVTEHQLLALSNCE